jgi:hypothetical protein
VRQTDGRPMKTQRDVNRRCVACGRRPDTECCVICHRSFDRLQAGRTISTCLVDDCFNRHKAKGYCVAHYSRWLRNDGDAFPDVPVGNPGRNLESRRTRETV